MKVLLMICPICQKGILVKYGEEKELWLLKCMAKVVNIKSRCTAKFRIRKEDAMLEEVKE